MPYFNQICVSLDIETSGLSKEKDKIIEIGLIKFKGEEIIDSFKSLVNPEIEVPYEVLSITGIKQLELKKAPKFQELKDKIKQFINNYPIVGHNIKFDLDFLEANGLKLNNQFYDTWQLSLILLPNLPTYSLEFLADFLKINPPEKHRALADAQTAYNLFNHLIKLIYQIDISKRKEINLFFQKSSSDLKDVFKQVKITRINKRLSKKFIFSKEKKNQASFPEKIDKEFLTKNIKLDLSENQLIELILKSFDQDKKVLLEALIKFPSFLIAAFYYFLTQKEKVIIVSKNCDYLKKEFLLLEEFFSWDFQFFNWPENFICLKKLDYFKKQENYSDSEIRFLIKIILWLDTNLEEINLSNEDERVLNRVIYNPFDCLFLECPFYQDCHFYKGKKKALDSSVILVNHFNFSNNFLLTPSTKFLPKAKKIIFLEPEYLEDNLTLAAQKKVDSENEINFWQDLENILNYYQLNFFDQESFKYLKKETERVKNRLVIYWGIWGMFKQSVKSTDGENLLLDEKIINNYSWERVKKTTLSLIFNYELIRGIIEKLIEKISKSNSTRYKLLILEFKNYLKFIQEKESFYKEFVFARTNKFIYWLQIKNEGKNVHLNKTPISIKETVKGLFDNYSSAVLISEAINQENFNYWQERLRLKNFEFRKIPLSQENNLPKVYLIKNLPEPNSFNYQKEIINYLENFLRKERGLTFVLFSSFEFMKESYKRLLPLAGKLNFKIFSQHQKNNYLLIKEIEKENDNFCLLGKADLLQKLFETKIKFENLLITKIYFDSRIYPVYFKKKQEEDNGFRDYSLPRSLIEFKKNLSAFLKIALPKANIYILDSRLMNKDYASEFLNLIKKFKIIIQK